MVNINPRVVVRSSAYPKDMVDRLFEVENIEDYVLELIQDNAFMERILIASEDLYQDLLRIRTKKITPSREHVRKTIKYLIRMSSRTAPFGLFAGICWRSHPESLATESPHKSIRISIEWHQHTAKRLEQLLSTSSSILIYKSNNWRETSDSVYMDLARGQEICRVELKKTAFISKLKTYLSSPRSMQEIIQYFSDPVQSLDDTILHSIKLLLRQDFLFSELRPSSVATGGNSLERMITFASSIDHELYDQLKAVQALLYRYEQLPVGEGIAVYLELKRKMKDICVTPNHRYLVVDTYVKDTAPELRTELIHALLQEIQFLKGFQVLQTNRIWGNYSNKFADQYGLYQEVPLLDVLDCDVGIGLPEMKGNRSEQEDQLDHYLVSLIQETLINGNSVIKLTANHIHRMETILRSTEHDKLQDGYDVKFSVIHEHGVEKILFTENAFRQTAGAFTGRFCDSSRYPMQKYKDDCYISAEINILPSNYADIGITYYPCEYEIVNYADPRRAVHQIELSDLYVGMDHHGLYIRSRSHGQKILPVTTHLLFYRNFVENPELIFLSEFGKYRGSAQQNINFASMQHLPFIPRLEYNHIILSPKRWQLF